MNILLLILVIAGIGYGSEEYYTNKYVPMIASRDTTIQQLNEKNQELLKSVNDNEKLLESTQQQDETYKAKIASDEEEIF